MKDAFRYVILQHTGITEPHFDLMIETTPGESLVTWRLTRWPIGLDDVAYPLAPHRPAYLTYEGPLGGDRGYVKRIAEGRCDLKDDRATFEDGSQLRL